MQYSKANKAKEDAPQMIHEAVTRLKQSEGSPPKYPGHNPAFRSSSHSTIKSNPNHYSPSMYISYLGSPRPFATPRLQAQAIMVAVCSSTLPNRSKAWHVSQSPTHPPTVNQSISPAGGCATGPSCITHLLNVLNLTSLRNPTFK